MGILAECPICKTRQSVKNKVCKCGEELDKAKGSKRVVYWVSYRLPNGTQKQERMGVSIDDARAADGKKKAQKKEGKLFDIRDDARMTFKEFSKWYLNLANVRKRKACWRVEISLNHFNSIYGDLIVSKIKKEDYEAYQEKRKSVGRADHTIDQEIGAVKTMIKEGFDNDMVSGETLMVCKRVKNLLKRNSNARKRILYPDDFNKLCEKASLHVKNAVSIAYYSGMRRGEILQLTWNMVDMKKREISIPAEITKDNESRIVPMLKQLYETMKGIPKAIHDNHVILYRGKPLKALGKALQRACDKTEIPYGRKTENGFTFHDLRHTFNTNMRKAGVDESVIMEITGHSTREMFDRYNTIDEEDTRNAVDKLEVFFLNVTLNVTQASKNQT